MPKNLELISAPAGTGKTFYCLQTFREALKEQKNPFQPTHYFVLPNQEHAERVLDLLLSHSLDGPVSLLSPAVMTIHDFVGRFAKISKEKTPGDLLRKLIIRKWLENNPASYFGRLPTEKARLSLLNDFLLEAQAGGVDARLFAARAEALKKALPEFTEKWDELAGLLRGYEKELGRLGLFDSADLVREFARHSEEEGGEMLDLVIMDGFYHFTPEQLLFVQGMKRMSRRMLVTLTRGEGRAAQGVFYYPDQTRRKLLDMGFREKNSGLTRNQRARQPALAFLEEKLFSGESGAVYGEEQDAVTVFEATGVSGEIEMIAREIRKLRSTEKYHYSDMALLLRGIGQYEAVILSVFRDFGIPVAVHERKKLRENPLARAFTRWIDLLLEDAPCEILFALLGSGCLGFTEEGKRAVEKAARAHAVAGGWENWELLRLETEPEGQEIFDLLLRQRARLLAAQDPRAVAAALEECARELGLLENVRPDFEDTREDHQAYRTLLGIFQEVALHLSGREKKSEILWKVFLERAREAIGLSLFSLKPTDKNRVQVYDIGFALQKEYEVVFLPGLLEKAFPRQINEDPVLKDEERMVFNQGVEYFPPRQERAYGERYLFYMAVTRAREKLYLTYPYQDLEGREALPSFFAQETRRIFGERLTVRRRSSRQALPAPEEAVRVEDYFSLLVDEEFAGQGKNREKRAALWQYCLKQEGFAGMLAKIARDEDRAELRDPRILEKLRGRDMLMSASALENFARCPFHYFAKNILRLNEDADQDQLPRGEGNILHAVLKEVYEAAAREDDFLQGLDADAPDLAARVEKAAGEEKELQYLAPYRKELLLRRLTEKLRLFLGADKNRLEQRKTRPRFFEKAFGTGEAGALPALQISAGKSKISLRGRIDRVDVDEAGQRAVVIDYKRGAKKLADGLEEGRALQLPLYLLAVQKLLGYEPAAGEYYPLHKLDKANGLYDEEKMAEVGYFKGGENGVKLSSERMKELLDMAETWAAEYAAGIQAGHIAIHSKDCDYCSFSALCRFEKWKLIYAEIPKKWHKARHCEPACRQAGKGRVSATPPKADPSSGGEAIPASKNEIVRQRTDLISRQTSPVKKKRGSQ